MAIQISGTTVIDNSRNFINIGTLTATSFSGKGAIPASSVMLFQQASAPTGFTKSTAHNDKILRVVSGSGGGSGGINSFSATFPSASNVPISVTGIVGQTTLTTPQIPSHSHDSRSSTPRPNSIVPTGNRPATNVFAASGNTGGDISHDHPIGTLSGSVDLRVQYVDVIIATRDT